MSQLPPHLATGSAEPATSGSGNAKATRKRALPHEENATQSQTLPDPSTQATGEKPSKRLRSSTVVEDIETVVFTPTPTTKPVVETAKTMGMQAIAYTAAAPGTSLPYVPSDLDVDVASTSSTPPNMNAPNPQQRTEIFIGSFDLYSIDQEAFNIAYALPNDANGNSDKVLHPEALYRVLDASQNNHKKKPTAKLHIAIAASSSSILSPDDDDEDDDCYGSVFLSSFHHPYCGGPVKIDVTFIRKQSQEALSPEIETDPRLARPIDGWKGPGISAKLEIEDDGMAFLIPEASGKICMRPLWVGVGEDGRLMELFEGSLTFQCIFSPRFAKRAGKGVNEKIVFWAVRGKVCTCEGRAICRICLDRC